MNMKATVYQYDLGHIGKGKKYNLNLSSFSYHEHESYSIPICSGVKGEGQKKYLNLSSLSYHEHEGYSTVSHISYAPLFQGPHFLTKLLESNILYDNLFIDILSV